MEYKLKELFNAVINNKKLTYYLLKDLGFSKQEIAELRDNNYIKNDKNDSYKFIAVDELLKYGYELTHTDKALSRICITRCYKLDPKHKETNLYLLRRNISKKKYFSCIKHVEALLNCDDQIYKSTAKLYLVLLSTLIKLPKDLIALSNNIELNELVFEQSLPNELNMQRSVAAAILDGHNPHALSILNDLIRIGNIDMFKAFTLRELLNATIDNNNLTNGKLLEMIKRNDFTSALSLLKKEQSKHMLTDKNKSILLLLEDALNISKGIMLPESLIEKTDSFEVAIECSNYELALSLFKKYALKRNLNLENDIRYQLLIYICNHTLKSKNNITASTNQISKDMLSILLEHLGKHDLKSAFRVLREYLDLINKREYEYLIIDLIKISILTNDITYANPLLVIIDIDKEDFKLDVNTCINCYYDAVSSGNMAVSALYFDIIKNTKDVTKDQISSIKMFLEENDLSAVNQAIDNDKSSYYGVKKFDELNKVICNSKYSLELICKQMGLADEDIDKIRLIYAREFYKQGNYVKGDMFLSAYEASPYKTYYTASIHNQIKRNREMYIIENTNDYVTLNLKMNP